MDAMKRYRVCRAMSSSPCVSRSGGRSAIVFRGVHGLPTEDGARVLEISVAPLVARVAEHDFVVQGGSLKASHEQPRDVALAAPHRELARGQRPVLGVHAADAHADDGKAVGVGELAAEGLAPDLADAVEPGGPHGGEMGEHRPRGEAVVAPRHEVAVERLAFDAAHGGAARCEDDALDLRLAPRLEDVVGSGDVDIAEGFPGRATELSGEMHYRVDALEGGPNGLEIRDVGAMARNAIHGAPVEGGELEAVADLLPEGAADEPAQARDEDACIRHRARLGWS